MKKTALALIAATAISIGTMPVEAGQTCKVIASLCPPAPGSGGKSVPEPASLALFAIGAGAAALARRRRIKK